MRTLISSTRLIHCKSSFLPSTRLQSSKRHYERRLLPYPQKHCFNVVADVSLYKNFVPWVKNSIILPDRTSATGTSPIASQPDYQSIQRNIDAELEIGFGMFTEKYISHVTLSPYDQVIAVSKQTNLFEHLQTEWKFSAAKDPTTCWVTFSVDFEFKSAIYNQLSDLFMEDVANNMVKAFEKQCKASYTVRA
jgi:coenzyme Q-binding protein COQ10